MQSLIFATNNTHKLKEIEHLFTQGGIEHILQSLSDIGLEGEIPEDFETLEENAMAKAAWVYERCSGNVFADDTGLEIDCLGGRPGVYSARYAGEGCSFEDNVQKVLAEMEGETRRQARFRTVIALILGGRKYFFEGIVDGEILEIPAGERGFGYDPIFRPEGFKQSFAEMDLDLKNTISHRARAFEKMVLFLKNQK